MSSKSADKGGYYILNLILLKNEPQIGRTLIKRGFYVLNLLKMRPKSAEGR